MAATGLLGINPYFKGVNLDISSKPVNLAIQLEQKNQAKREALDKYFMDYEKSINPAGMRSQDQDIVLKKLNDNKQFYMQNRDRILNPSKYGAEAQSRYMAGFKDILSDISKSKQASAEDKVLQNTYSRVKTQGLEIPDGFMEAVQESQKPIYAGYKPVDLFQFDFNKPFSTEKFQRDIFAGIEPDKINVGSRRNKEGQIINIYKNEFDKDSLKSFANRAASQYRTNPSVTKEVNKLIKTGEYVDLQPYYEMLNPKMSIQNADPADVAAAFALSLKQLGKTTESAPVFKPAGPKPEDTSGENNPLHPSNLVEEIRVGNPNYLVGGIDTKNADLIDVTSQFGGYNLYKTNTKDGVILAPAKNVVYNKANDRFYVKGPSKNQEPEYLTPEAFKTKIIVNNPDISSKVKGWGKPIKNQVKGGFIGVPKGGF
jgi:hypothetical protein